MRVVHLTSVHPPFDIRIFSKECRTLAQAGYDTHLVAAHDGPQTEVDGVHVHSVPKAKGRAERMTKTVAAVLRKAMELRGDIYHFHDPELIPAGIRLKAAGASVIYDCHESTPLQIASKYWVPKPLRGPVASFARGAEFLAGKSFDRIVAATAAIADGFPAGNTTVVQNFPHIGELTSRAPTPHAERPAHVCYLGSITKIRGLEEMVRAIGLTEARLQLAGNFVPEGLDREAEGYPGWDQVDALGYRSRAEAADLLDSSRAGLILVHPLPNHIAAQPNKLFEYMSAGLPLIASDFPLWRKIVIGEDCGLVADPMDPSAIAKAIQTILTDPEDAERLGRNGRRAVEEKYNWAKESQKLLGIYEDLKEKRR